MRVVFMGTPEFAVPSLKVAHKHNLVAVVTQPDRPQGRQQKIKFSPIKEAALAFDIPIFQPKKINTSEFYQKLVDLEPEIIVVVAFGQKLPPKILNLPTYGCVNVHASLLPKYRGAAPIHSAIINGEEVTGVSTMFLSEGWDEGDVILQAPEAIRSTDTAGQLHDRLAIKGATLLEETLALIKSGRAEPQPQDHDLATYAPKLERKDGLIDWELPADKLYDFVRGMNPWPSAYTYFDDETIKIWHAVPSPFDLGSPGDIVALGPDGISVATGRGALILKEVQRQGLRKMSGFDLANGLRIRVGQKFEG